TLIVSFDFPTHLFIPFMPNPPSWQTGTARASMRIEQISAAGGPGGCEVARNHMQSRVLAILIAVVLALVATAAMVVYVNGADKRALRDQEPVAVMVGKETIHA